ncbi:MAG: hypothetical protein QM270_01250 [Bacillota bacterium]|nr:hypothetical protein [Bacillota bacterium]
MKNNIFLSNPEIEIWIAACLGIHSEELDSLGYEKGNTVWTFLRQHQGNHETACEQLAEADLYFEKRDFKKKGIYRGEAILVPHSNLVYFIDYMKSLIYF